MEPKYESCEVCHTVTWDIETVAGADGKNHRLCKFCRDIGRILEVCSFRPDERVGC